MFGLKRADNKESSRRREVFLGKAKVNKLFLVSMLGAVQYIVMMVTDRVIVGQMLGSDAVAGVVTISPVFELSSVFDLSQPVPLFCTHGR